MSKYLTKPELDYLKQLKIIRTDSNSEFQKLIATYNMLLLDVEDLESLNKHVNVLMEDYKLDYNTVRDELEHIRKEYEKIEKQNRTLNRSLSRFVKDLDDEGLITRSDSNDKYDTSI